MHPQRLERGVSLQPPENFLDTVKRASLTSTSSESDQASGGHTRLATARHQSPGRKLWLGLRCRQKQRESSFFSKAEETVNIKIGVLFPWLFLERSLSKEPADTPRSSVLRLIADSVLQTPEAAATPRPPRGQHVSRHQCSHIC